MSSAVALVSSTQSCSRPAQTDGTSRRSSEMMRATPDRVDHVGLAGAAPLAGVALGGELEAALDEAEVGGGVVAARPELHDLLDVDHCGWAASAPPACVRASRAAAHAP